MSLIRNYQGINYVPPLIVKDDKGGGAPSTGGTVSNTPTTPTPAGAQGDYTFSGEDIVSIYNRVLLDIDKTDKSGDTSDDVSAAETEVANAKTAVEDSKTAVSEAETGVSEAQTDVDTAQTAVSKAETNVTTAQTAVDTAQTTVDECSADIATKETAITDAQTAVDNASTAYATAEANFTNAMSNLEALMAQADANPDTDYSAEIAEAEAAVQAAQEQLDQAQAAKEQAEQNLQTAQTALDEAKTKLADAEDALKKAQEELAIAEDALKTAKSDLEKAQSNLEKAKTALEDAKQKQTEAENALKDAETKLEEAKAKAAEEAEKENETGKTDGTEDNPETRGVGDDVETGEAGESNEGDDSTDGAGETTPVEPIPADDINKAINDNYADLVGTTLDETTMNDIVSMAQAYAQAQGVSSVEDLQKFIDMGVKLAQTAESKEVGKTDYISARIVDFMAMQEANPDMTLDEMNTELAENYAMTDIATTLEVAVNSVVGEDIANSDATITEKVQLAMKNSDENPDIKNAYYETQSALYLAAAQNGELTNSSYYNGIVIDLLETFPGSANLSVEEYSGLYDKIATLSPEEIEEFQKAVLEMPANTNEDYESSLNELLESLNSKTTGREAYVIENGDELKTFNELFEKRYDTEFNEDEVIEYAKTQEAVAMAIQIDAEKTGLIEILDSAPEGNDSATSEAIYTALYSLTGSTDDAELTTVLQNLTGMTNVKVEGTEIIIEGAVLSRGASTGSGTTMADVKDAMKTGMTNNANETTKILLKDKKPSEEGGFWNRAGNWARQKAVEAGLAVLDWIDPSQETLETIQNWGTGVAIGGLAVGTGATLTGIGAPVGAAGFLAAGAGGAISSGASFVSELKNLNDAWKNGEIQLYDENGNWAPDEKAQEMFFNMDKDAALVCIDLLSAGAGSKLASAVKAGKWASSAISNGVNGLTNIGAGFALQGDGETGSNVLAAGIGMLFDVKLSTANNLMNGAENAWDNFMKKLSGEDSFGVLFKNKTGSIFTKVGNFPDYVTKQFEGYGEGYSDAFNDFLNTMLKNIADGEKLSGTNTGEILEDILKKYKIIGEDGTFDGGGKTDKFIQECLEYLGGVVGEDFHYLMTNDNLNSQAYQELYSKGITGVIVNNTFTQNELDDITKALIDAGYDGTDDSIIRDFIAKANINENTSVADALVKMIEEKFYKNVRATQNAYGFDNVDQIKQANDFGNKIKDMILDGKNTDEIEAFIKKAVADGDLDGDLYERVMKYCMDDPSINQAMKNKNISASQMLGLVATIASGLGITFTPDANASNGNGANTGLNGEDDVPTIDGGELSEITVTGEAGKNVTVKDGYTFIAVSDASGNVYYRVQDQEGNLSYVSEEVFDKMIKGGFDTQKVLNNYAETDPENISEELIGHDWTDDEKNTALVNLKLAFGLDYEYSIAYNFDGTISFTAIDKDGKIVLGKDSFDYHEDVGNEELEGHNWTDKEKANVELSLKMAYGPNYNYSIVYNFDGTYTFEIFGADGKKVTPEEALAAKEAAEKAKLKAGLDWMNKNFSDGKGNFDGQRFTNWVNSNFGEGSAYYYIGNSAQEAFDALLKASSTGDWSTFWQNVGNYGNSSSGSNSGGNSGGYGSYGNNGNYGSGYGYGYGYGNSGNYYTGGFDVFSTGGNPYGGGIVYNEYGQIDWKNSWLSLTGGGGMGGSGVEDPDARRDEAFNQNCQVMMQVDDRM